MQPIKPVRTAVFVGAHPDDETIMAGGTLVMLHQQGVRTHIVCATDGRGGEGASDPETLARLRADELAQAGKALGAASVTLLPYHDPVAGPDDELFAFADDENALAAEIAHAIQALDADLVLTHGTDGEYGHPAHRQVHRAVLLAAQVHVPHVLVYTVAAQMPGQADRLFNTSDPAHLALDITPWVEAKHDAMLCHRTQHALFKRRRKLKTVRESIRMLESFRRQWPACADGEPHDGFTACMLGAGAWRPNHAGS